MTMADQEPKVPFYDQLIATLRADIESGRYPPGSRMPSEAELCETFQVSRITVRQAMAELTRMGLVVRMQGKGTFVRLEKVNKSLVRFAGFAEEMRERGRQPRTRILDLSVQVAGEQVRAALKLPPNGLAIRFERLRLADDVPLALKVSYLPHDLFRDLLSVNLEEVPLYDAMAAIGGHVPHHADETLEVLVGPRNLAHQLTCPPGTPLLLTTEIVYTDLWHPIEYVHSYYRGDAYRFTWQATRHKEQ